MKRTACCFLILTLFILGFSKMSNYAASPTEQFILKWMTNSNGTLAAYLIPATPTDPDEVAGREALSESVGLWMTYTVEKNDHHQFQLAFQRLQHYFMTKDGFIYWKLTPTGKSDTSANALIDDLRIVNALYKAGQVWGNPQYTNTARSIAQSLSDRNQRNHYLVDYFDLNNGDTATTLSVSYIDTSALTHMYADHQIGENLYRHMMSIAKHPPMKNGFFPKSFDVQNGRFHYSNTANMINQSLIALHQADAGVPNTHFLNFISGEFHHRGLIYGRYNTKTKQPAVSFESPSVYGLLILYCLQMNQTQLAGALDKRMTQLRENDKSNPYYGGYIERPENNTHIFDNLVPLLAGEALKKNQ